MDEFKKEFWHDADNTDPFNITRAYKKKAESHLELGTLLFPLTLKYLKTAQRADEFCTSVSLQQFAVKDGSFSKDANGLLRQKYLHNICTAQIVVLQTGRSRLLAMMHYVLFAGHPGQNKMYHVVRRDFYCLHMAASAMVTVQNFWLCAPNWVRL